MRQTFLPLFVTIIDQFTLDVNMAHLVSDNSRACLAQSLDLKVLRIGDLDYFYEGHAT
jgi:hypothetical protein